MKDRDSYKVVELPASTFIKRDLDKPVTSGNNGEKAMGGSLMGIQKVKFSSQASPEALTAMREIASREGRQFQAVLQEAMEEYIVNRNRKRPRPEVMAHFRASVARNRRLYELLAE